MNPCLQPDEIIDYVEGALGAERAWHVATCRTCQAAAADVRAGLAAAAGAEIPEPSPFFWHSINRRVAAAITQSPAARDGWRAWLAWDTPLPMAVIGAVLMALGLSIGRPPAPPAPTMATAPVTPRAAETAAATTPDAAATPADDALALVVDLAGTLSDAGADALALAPLPDLGDVAATALSDDELQALAAILRAAVDLPKS
jgi:hypothetical protein